MHQIGSDAPIPSIGFGRAREGGGGMDGGEDRLVDCLLLVVRSGTEVP